MFKKKKTNKVDNRDKILSGIEAISYVELSPKLIKGIQELSSIEIKDELFRGAKFITYEYCISIIIATVRRESKVYFIRAGENGLKYSIPYIIVSLILGWWALPLGPFYTIRSIIRNLCSGKDVTEELLVEIGKVVDDDDVIA